MRRAKTSVLMPGYSFLDPLFLPSRWLVSVVRKRKTHSRPVSGFREKLNLMLRKRSLARMDVYRRVTTTRVAHNHPHLARILHLKLDSTVISQRMSIVSAVFSLNGINSRNLLQKIRPSLKNTRLCPAVPTAPPNSIGPNIVLATSAAITSPGVCVLNGGA